MKVDAEQVARAALRLPVVSARVVARMPIAYDPYLAGRVVERVTGVARALDGADVQWTAIVKRTEGSGLRAARRELAVYRDGIASAGGPTGLRAPRLLAWADDGERIELWLEDVRDEHAGIWPIERFAVAAAHIAAWDVAAGRRPLPAGFDSEDAWAERHGQPHRVDEALAELDSLAHAARAAEVAALLADPGFARVRALIASTAERLDTLYDFPQTFLHHDLVRSNLFAVNDASTVAIDWENVGRGPLGVDLAPLTIGSVRRGEASSDELREIEALVLAEYEHGLRDAGVGPDHDVRRAYRLAVGLRWHVVLGAIRTWLHPDSAGFRGSRPDESRAEALRHLLAVSRHILDIGLAGL